MQKINKILITGGSGFIGTNLHIKLKKNKKNKIINIDTKKPMESSLLDDWVVCDIRNHSKLKKILNNFKPTIVYHLAARTDLNGKNLKDYNSNTLGTKNILSLVSSNKNIKKFLYTSTRFVFNMDQNPKNDFDYSASTVYGESKVVSEKYYFDYLKKLPKHSILTRPTSIWGPYFGEPYYNFFKIIKKKLYFHPTTKKTYKSFGYVENTVLQMIKLCNSKKVKKNEVYYLCDYKPYEMYLFANQISNRFNKTNIIRIPFKLSYFLALFGSLLKLINIDFPLTLFRLNNMTTNSVFKNENLNQILKNLPFNMKRSINRTYNWLRKNEKDFN